MTIQNGAVLASATDTGEATSTRVNEVTSSRRNARATKKTVAPSQSEETVSSDELKKKRIDANEQKNLLLDILMPHVVLNGKTVMVNLPRANGVTRAYPLRPIKGSQDVVKDWIFDQFHTLHGKRPALQAYKAMCDAVRVSLFEEVDARNLQAITLPGQDIGASNEEPVTVSDPSLFTKKVHVDGHDNLYIFDNRKIGRLKTNEEGDEFIGSTLWGENSFPKVYKVYTVHNTYEGQQTQYDMEIAGDRQTLPIDTLKNGNWISYFPRVTGVLDSSKERIYKAVVMQLAKVAPKVDAYDTSGWHKVTVKDIEQWVYLLPDGRFIAHKCADTRGLDVRLIHDILSPEERELWDGMALPTEALSIESRQEAYNYLKGLVPRGQLLTLLAHNIGAILYGLRSTTFGPSHSLVFVAPPGSGKTAEAGLMRCLSAPFKYPPLPDASFQDTVTSVEDDLTYRVSMPVFVDDFVWLGASDIKKKGQTDILEGIARAVFNQKPVRKRMKSKRSGGMEKQRSNYIHTLPVFTVECIPDTLPASTYRRVFIMRQGMNDVNKYPTGPGTLALSQMERYAPVLQSWGYGIVSFFLEQLAVHSHEEVIGKLQILYKQLLKKTRSALTDKWLLLQAHCDIPSDWDSIADAAAYEMLYFQVFRMTVGRDLATHENDLFPHLIDAAYDQLLRMDNRVPDEEGLLLFETALLQFIEEIRSGKMVNGERWRIDRKVTSKGTIEPPAITTKNEYPFPNVYWGWIEEVDIEHPVYPRQKVVAYVDNCNAMLDDSSHCFIYLSQDARHELLKIVRTLPGGEAITSEEALGRLAEHEGWMSGKRESGKQRTFKITPPQGPLRVWAIRLDRFLAHFNDVAPENDQEIPENVTPFPGNAGYASLDVEQDIVNGTPLEGDDGLPDPDEEY